MGCHGAKPTLKPKDFKALERPKEAANLPILGNFGCAVQRRFAAGMSAVYPSAVTLVCCAQMAKAINVIFSHLLSVLKSRLLKQYNAFPCDTVWPFSLLHAISQASIVCSVILP